MTERDVTLLTSVVVLLESHFYGHPFDLLRIWSIANRVFHDQIKQGVRIKSSCGLTRRIWGAWKWFTAMFSLNLEKAQSFSSWSVYARWRDRKEKLASGYQYVVLVDELNM